MGFNIGGMAAAYEGYKQGQDEELGRQQRASDLEYQKGQRTFQTQQQARVTQQQQREDARRVADSAVPTTRDVTQSVVTPGSPEEGQLPEHDAVHAQAAVPREEQIRQMADNARKAGAHDDWFKLNTEADKLEATRMSAKLQDAAASAQGKDPLEAATIMTNVFSPDSGSSMHMANPRKNADGSVTVDVFSRESGATTQRTYKNTDELVNGAMALADPTRYAAVLAEQRKAQAKIQEEQAKPTVVPAGSVLVQNGRVVTRNDNKLEWTGNYNADGTPEMRPAANTRAGAAGPAGKAPAAPSEQVAAMLQELTKLKTSDMSEEQFLAARETGARIMSNNVKPDGSPAVPPEMAARIAHTIAKDPTKVVPGINPATGKIDRVFDAGADGTVVIQAGIGDPKNPGIPPEAAQAATTAMLTKLPADVRKRYLQAASDPAALEALRNDVNTFWDKAAEQSSQGMPETQRQVVLQRAQAQKRQQTAALDSMIAYTKAYAPEDMKREAAGVKSPKDPAVRKERYDAQIGGIRRAIAANPFRPEVDEQERAAGGRAAGMRPPGGMLPPAGTSSSAQLRDRLRSDLAGEALTVQKAKTLPPSRAKALIDKYGDLLPPDVARQLKLQAS